MASPKSGRIGAGIRINFPQRGEVIRKADAMTLDRIDRTGFAPRRHECVHGRRSTVVAQLITTVSLVLSIAVAATAVSIGIARADGLAAVAEDPNAHIAILLSLVLVGMGGLTAFMSRGRTRVKPGE
jgi:hypothetical protein